jgi:hypothetical protein
MDSDDVLEHFACSVDSRKESIFKHNGNDRFFDTNRYLIVLFKGMVVQMGSLSPFSDDFFVVSSSSSLSIRQSVIKKMVSLLVESSEEFISWMSKIVLNECVAYVEMGESRGEDDDREDRGTDTLCPLEILIHLLHSMNNISEVKDTKTVGDCE